MAIWRAMRPNWRGLVIITFEIAGESLFAIRGRDGQIPCFIMCANTAPINWSSGKGTTRVVVCPYHAWTYELTGELRAGPNINAVEGFDKSEICLTEVRAEEFLGFVFVNLRPECRADGGCGSRMCALSWKMGAELGRSQAVGMGGNSRKLQLESLG
jgi:nitrite reductase/ring-hydroxylating ferredoxin subunit